jgi:hypothetical protein
MSLRGASRLLRRAAAAPPRQGLAAAAACARRLSGLPAREPSPGPPPVGEVGPPTYAAAAHDAQAGRASAGSSGAAPGAGPWSWRVNAPAGAAGAAAPRVEVASPEGERERDAQGRALGPRVGARARACAFCVRCAARAFRSLRSWH